MTPCTKIAALLAYAVALILPGNASAQPSDDEQPVTFILDFSSGYATPLGSPDSGAPDAVRDVLKGLVPVQGEAGVILASHWRVLAYGAVGFLVRSNSCRSQTVACGGSSVHVGGKVAYSGRGPGRWDLLVGLGLGWQRLRLSTQTDTTITDSTATGVEGVLELAALYPIASSFALGPFLGATLASSPGWMSVIDGQTSQQSVSHQYGWLSFGLKIEIRLWAKAD
jgi:hypothetical protein